MSLNDRSEPVSRASSNRDGFALPMAILVIALVTVGLMASFATTNSEIGNISSQRAQARAYSIAQGGLEQFISRRNEAGFCPHCAAVNGIGAGTFPTRRETLVVAISGGAAIVRATPVRVNVLTGVGTYLITSTGYDSAGTVYTGSSARLATRTVGLFATYTRSTMNVLAGWTSLSGIEVNGGAATISGIDGCGSGNNVAGLSVPYDPATGKADMDTHGNWAPTGSPPYDTLKTFAQESAAVKIDWRNIKDGVAMPADIVIPGGTFPSSAQFAADSTWYPVIHILASYGGNFSLPNQGRGTLIVDNDLTISGSNQWSGIILVGGKITSNGNNVSAGATLSGLDYLIGGRPGSSVTSSDNSTANGTKQYIYNSCSVAAATNGQAKYYVISNSWMDNLAGY